MKLPNVRRMIDIPNCSSCSKQSTINCPYVTTHESVMWIDEDGNTLQDEQLSMSVSITGCISHPDTRKYLMRDLIKKLECYKNCQKNKGAVIAYNTAISLINGVE